MSELANTVTVLAIHVGPVQPFIEAARRFSDLKAGSAILSDLARAVAQGVEAAGANLIFPASARQVGVANKIVAVCPSAEVARSAAGAGRRELARSWTATVEWVRAHYTSTLDLGAFDEQARVEDWAQFYAAWATRATYHEAWVAAERLLDGRKRNREFRQREGRAAAKSWQDPGREDVISRTADRVDLQQKRLLKKKERLDALTFVKRFHPDRESFASVNEVTVRAPRSVFLAGAPTARREALLEFAKRAGNHEPAWYYPDRLRAEGPDAGLSAGTIKDLLDLLRKSRFTPTPYYALVVADGDSMGARIDHLAGSSEGAAAHRRFSGELGAFAQQIVKRFGGDGDLFQEFQGDLIYAGGDDFLGIFPLDTALPAVERLASLFSGAVTGGTISAGVAVAHMLEPFDRVREWARQAERSAKDWRRKAGESRGAVAVRLQKRSGEHLTVRGPMTPALNDDALPSVPALLRAARDLFEREALSQGAPYDLRRGLANAPAPAAVPLALRILDRKRRKEADPASDAVARDEARRVLEGAMRLQRATPAGAALSPSFDLLVLARFLHAHRPRTGGE